MNEFLRSVWHEPRAPRAPSNAWWDWVVIGVLAALAVVEVAVRDDLRSPAMSLTVTLGLLPTLRWRRSRPLLVVGIAFSVSALTPVVTGHEPELHTIVYMLLLPFALFRWGSGREVVLGSAVVLAAVGSALALGFSSLADTVAGVVVLSTVVTLAVALRFRVRARLRELDQVKLLERERLARDLHDTVAHHVSAMAIRAQAGIATAGAHPEAAVDALRVIEAEASKALAEMRSMVRVLREGEPLDLAPNASLADVEQLASRWPVFGPTVEVEVVGDVDDLPPSVGSTTYRLAQESVTNARRHARNASRIAVRVVVDDSAVRLRVTDDGEHSTRPAAARGHGLIGMVERAHLLGGSCEAGPDPDRGWTVTAVLPLVRTTA
ncbi:sensor histidine kinase [Actinosynnema sp. CA-248983]